MIVVFPDHTRLLFSYNHNVWLQSLHFINTLARKYKRVVIGHLTVFMLVYSAVLEKSYESRRQLKSYDAYGKCNLGIRD